MKIKVCEHVNATLSTPKCAAEVARAITGNETGEKITVTYAGETRLVDAGRFASAMKHLHREGSGFDGKPAGIVAKNPGLTALEDAEDD